MQQPLVEMSDIAILGAGLSGLAASMRCKAPVFEAAGHTGGVAYSDTVDDFVFDRGIHVLNTKSTSFIEFLRGLGVDMAPVNRIAHIYSHGVYTAYPFQVNTARLPVPLRVRCTWDFIRRESNPEPQNYEQWMHRFLGRGFANTFLVPYSEKFWGISPAEMTFDWTGTKVPVPSVGQVVRGAVWNKQTAIGSNALFHYPQNGPGYGTIADALRARCGPVHTGHRATHIDPAQHTVRFENGHSVKYKVLLSTIPLPQLVNIIDGAPTEVVEAASKLRANRILVVNLGVNRPNISEKHWIHFPEKDIAFFRLSFPHNFSPRCVPEGKSSVSVEVSCPPNETLDHEAITERVITDLVKVGVMRSNDQIVARHTYDIKQAYCIYDRNRKASVNTIKKWLDTIDIVPAGRFGLWSYFWSDEAIKSGSNCAGKVMRRLGREVENHPFEEEEETAAA
ncbi:MAG: FAD-dependent oxidoreductase [Pseudomonadota bacterium]|nr:FAD-dependent oxidoreductase [Pseudomonadota bacterium]